MKDYNIAIDISKIPFATYGSTLALMQSDGKLTVEWVGKLFYDRLISLSFSYRGREVRPAMTATPACITVQYMDAKATVCMHNDTSFYVDSVGFDICVTPRNPSGDNFYGAACAGGLYELISPVLHCYTDILLFAGRGSLAGPIERIFDTDKTKIDRRAILKIEASNQSIRFLFHMGDEQLPRGTGEPNAAEDMSRTVAQWAAFAATMPEVDAEYEHFALLSWYNIWSATIKKSISVPYDSVLMSKRFMTSVWSWDHCFNAMALCESDSEFAFQQFMLPYRYQSSTGALPDSFAYNDKVIYAVTKPPIHGWAFAKIWAKNPNFTTEQLEEVYRVMSAQTNWWMDYRDTDADGIPDYPQGCDSGIDNGTNFLRIGYFVESPDLPCLLYLQMQTLSDIARALHRTQDSDVWLQRGEKLLSAFYSHSMQDGVFVSRSSGSHETNPMTQNFLNLMPLMLGKRLPQDVKARLVAILCDRHLTQYGIATEGYRNRKYYKSDGYWQGPIWAPTTYMFVDALLSCGEKPLAKDIACRYLHMAVDVAKGNYENFDALRGNGLRAPGYTWTAAVTLLLMRRLHLHEFD